MIATEIELGPFGLQLTSSVSNPAIPKSWNSENETTERSIAETVAVGPERVYLEIPLPRNVVHPWRPTPGSVMDMEVIMEHCDYSQSKVCERHREHPWRAMNKNSIVRS